MRRRRYGRSRIRRSARGRRRSRRIRKVRISRGGIRL